MRLTPVSRRHRAAAVAVALAIASATVLPVPAAAAQALAQEPFESCAQRLARAPDDYESAFCFYAAALERRLWDQGARVFERLIRRHPGNFWLPLAYGHLHRNRVPRPDPDRAEALYRRAADGFQAAGHAEGEILARSNLRDILVPRGRAAEASREVARVVEIGAATTDPVLQARAWSLEATHVMETGRDLGLAYRLLRQTERAIFPAGPYRLQRTCLLSLGLVAFRLGRVDEALAVFRRVHALARAQGDEQTEATAQYNVLNTESMRETFMPTPGARDRLTQLARETLATAVGAAHIVVTLKAHRALASLMAQDPGTRREALEHANRCVALAAEARQPVDESACAWLKAMLLHEDAPDDARAAQVRALQASASVNNPVADAMSARRHMFFSWLTKPRPDAIRDSLAAIEAIETLRALQDAADSTAQLFSAWTSDYYWFSGRLLQDPLGGDIDMAFAMTERLRARTLAELRERSRTSPDRANPAVVEREAVLGDIASVQRTLMDPTVGGHQRQAMLERLEALEARVQEADRRIAVSAGRHTGELAGATSLLAVQSALAPNEALLSFQVGIWESYEGEFGGGSWLLAITRDRRRVYRIPDRSHFAPMVPVFTGLLARGDGLEIAAAVRLYRDVFSTALDDLPSGTDRLIIVADGPLQHLPFDALRAARDAPPLAARYELTATPSAALWLDWRKNPVPPAPQGAFALADPELSTAGQGDAADRSGVLLRGGTLGRLPHARRESRALSRHIGSVDALVGPLASEYAVKTRDLRDYQIVHFAAHAIADETHPERSAVFLSPGADSEDGLLQAREIGELRLEGRIVVLSACQTASGAVLSGEGVLSLARAFFQAGARTVIGTRWPVRDEDAASLFETFYEELGKGASISEALARTKIEAMSANRPPQVWAGLVLLGDGTSRPFPAGAGGTVNSKWPWTTAGLAIAAAMVLAGRRALASRRLRYSRSSPL